MKTYNLLRGRKSQVFITVLIVLAVVLTLGVAILFHSRSFRGTSRLQIEAEQAYSLAKSGIGIGGTLIPTSDPCGSIPPEVHNTYNVGGGTIKIDIYPGTGILKSTGTMGKSVRVLTKTFTPATGGGGGGWAKAYVVGEWNELLYTLHETSGGYVLGGWSSSFPNPGNPAGLVIRINADGQVATGQFGPTGAKAFSDEIGGTKDLWFRGGERTYDNGSIMVGESNAFTPSMAAVAVNLNTTGTVTWKRIFDVAGSTDKFKCVQQTDDDGDGEKDDGYIFGGYSDDPAGGGKGDALVMKTNSQGIITWQRVFGNTPTEWAYSIKEINNGYLIGGYSSSAKNEMLVIKLDDNGHMDAGNFGATGVRSYGGSKAEVIHRLLEVTGGYLLAGESTSFGADNDITLIRTNSNGDVGTTAVPIANTWAKTYDVGEDDDTLYDIKQTAAGNGYIVSGYAVFGNHYKGLLMEVSSDGTTVNWAKTYWVTNYGADYEYIRCADIELLDEGGYTIGIYSTLGSGAVNRVHCVVMKIDDQGNIICGGGDCAEITVTDITGSVVITDIKDSLNMSDVTIGEIDSSLVDVSGEPSTDFTETEPTFTIEDLCP